MMTNQSKPTKQAAASGFTFGTLVHTKEGLKPIEQIKAGDYVLSKPESGKGEKAYKRVVNTFVHEDKLVRDIAYRTTDGSNETNRLYVTTNHPFGLSALVGLERIWLNAVKSWKWPMVRG